MVEGCRIAVAVVVVRHTAYAVEVVVEEEETKHIHTDSEEARKVDFVVVEMHSQGHWQVVVEHTHEEPVVEGEAEENMSNLVPRVLVGWGRGNYIPPITALMACVAVEAELEEAVYRN